MELTDILMDSLIYPSKNLKALAIYLLMAIIIGIVMVATGVSTVLASSSKSIVGLVVAFIGLIVVIALMLLIEGYSLDIIKIAINREEGSPKIDFNRQVSNGIKYLIVLFVYMLIPIIVTIVLSLIFQHWVVYIISIVLVIVFTFALYMAECRLAQTDNLGHALDVKGSIDDLMAIGIVKVALTVIAVVLISIAIIVILGAIVSLARSDILTAIVVSIAQVYLLFFSNRSMGLLYSEK